MNTRRAFLRNTLFATGAAALAPSLIRATTGQGPALSLNKRERMLAWLQGELNYVPAAFFMHFDEAHKVGLPAAQKHQEYFARTGMDFVKIQYEQHYAALPWLQQPKDWARLECRGLDFYEPQLVTVRELVKNLKKQALVVMTLYSPFMWAGHCATLPVLLRHMKEDPEAVAKGLERLMESQLLFVKECIRIGVDGFYMSTQGSETGQFEDPVLFQKYVRPTDLPAMQLAMAHCPFNVLHVCDYNSLYASYAAVADYPGQVINLNPTLTGQTLPWSELQAQFGNRPCFGGLEKKGVISRGTPGQIKTAVRNLLSQAPRRFMLGSECTVPGDTPWENLQAAIETAHAFRET